MTIVHLMRHGETVWNAEGKLQGQTDIPLSDTGKAQVKAQSAAVVKEDVHVVSSDLLRTQETARLLGFDQFAVDARLREINVGAWEGRLTRQIIAECGPHYQDWRFGRFTPLGGEIWVDFCLRTEAALTEHAHTADKKGKELLLVCHGGVIRSILAHVLALPVDRFHPVKPASKTTIILAESARLLTYNWLA